MHRFLNIDKKRGMIKISHSMVVPTLMSIQGKEPYILPFYGFSQ